MDYNHLSHIAFLKWFDSIKQTNKYTNKILLKKENIMIIPFPHYQHDHKLELNKSLLMYKVSQYFDLFHSFLLY